MIVNLFNIPKRLDVNFEQKLLSFDKTPCRIIDIFHAPHHKKEIDIDIPDPVVVSITKDKPNYVHTRYAIISKNDLKIFA